MKNNEEELLKEFSKIIRMHDRANVIGTMVLLGIGAIALLVVKIAIC